MNDELKQLVEDAAKLLGYKHVADSIYDAGDFVRVFDPLDPERGDLMKVAMASGMRIDHCAGIIEAPLCNKNGFFMKTHTENFKAGLCNGFDLDGYQSLAIAVLRAASSALKARGEA